MLTLEVLGVGEELHELELRGEPLPVPATRLQTQRLRGVDVHGLAWPGPRSQNCLRKLSGISGKFRVPRKRGNWGNSVRNKMESLLFPQHPFSRSAQNRPSPGIRERRRYRSFYQRSASDRGRERTHSHRKRGAQVPTPTSTPRPIETTTSTQHHPARWFQV